MRKLLLAAVALSGLGALATQGAVAATPAFAVPATHVRPQVTQVDYYWHHRPYHHRHWEHNRWRYWN